jgi:hypothetical protein
MRGDELFRSFRVGMFLPAFGQNSSSGASILAYLREVSRQAVLLFADNRQLDRHEIRACAA